MHRTLRLAAALTIAAAPVVSHAQDATATRPVSFGVSAGLSMPMGNLSDSFNSGFNVTGHIAFKPAMFTNLSFRGDVGFDRFNAKGDLANAAVSLEGTYTVIGISANAVYAFPQSDPSAMLRPYLIGGVGMYNLKNKVTTTAGTVETVSESSATKPGVQAGAGVEFALSGFSTFAEAKFVNVFGDGSSVRWVPISFGIRF
jgi:opacity protein-like surface antigen